MSYQERLERKAARLDSWAESRERKAEDARKVSHEIADQIPMGQPVLLGHHSQKAHEKAIARSWNKLGESIEHTRKAEDFRRRADSRRKHAERIAQAVESSPEDYQPGDRVIARFTNSHRIFEFEGEIVDRTLNVWKVRAVAALPSPYGESSAGQVFHIPAMGRPKHSANNGIVGRV